MLCHLPNPGRLWELLIPGAEVILTKNEKGKTDFTVIGVKSSEGPILLHTHRTNDLVEALLANDGIPSLKGYKVIKREITRGNSRFDFLLETPQGGPFLLEVKSCTLFGSQGAMFPDAPSSRATKHVSELGKISTEGTEGGILFVVHSPKSRWFCPEYHTDPDFARAILAEKNRLKISSLAVKWDEDLSVTASPREIPIRWETLEAEFRDKGGCLALFHLPHRDQIAIHREKEISLGKGFWVLATGASNSLQKIASRLKNRLPSPKIIPFRANHDLGPSLSGALTQIASQKIDVGPLLPQEAGAHLFRFDENPLESSSFVKIIIETRINRLNI
ncbi:sugar fermentation stimulation protein A [Dethiosulfovibrio salsuginis]|uniref:Sugar fermentation stimulation protein A n=1 Tax=Dethiosulfovibrio salsuginis TaxID=561720 RepID=A0A1X7IWV5_9BACT|nr:sugar fermentation stimulation protein A [Dethiosulfovibrio salsuginis]